jgi:deazaflavin-dependent oxidoreductase (nitroreductase family)
VAERETRARRRLEREARAINRLTRSVFGRYAPRLQAAAYKRLKGRLLTDRWLGARVMVVETTGRRSGKVRATPVVFARDGDALVSLAANAGNDRTPAWWLNLQANPRATIQLYGERFTAVAHEAVGEERERRREAHRRVYPRGDEYQRLTERQIPVVVFERAPSG